MVKSQVILHLQPGPNRRRNLFFKYHLTYSSMPNPIPSQSAVLPTQSFFSATDTVCRTHHLRFAWGSRMHDSNSPHHSFSLVYISTIPTCKSLWTGKFCLLERGSKWGLQKNQLLTMMHGKKSSSLATCLRVQQLDWQNQLRRQSMHYASYISFF
jgi:hypothetical protein